MSWIITGVAIGGVSLISSVSGNIAQNKAQQRNNEMIRQSAEMQANIKKKYLKQSYDIQMHELYSMSEEFDKEVGVDLTNLLYESEKMKGQIANTTAFRNVSGNASARLQNVAEIQKELSNDMLQQELQNKYMALGKEINSARLNYERESLDITMGLAGSLSQQNFNYKSTAEIAMGGAMAGIGGFMMGKSLGSAFSSTPNTINSGITGASTGTNISRGGLGLTNNSMNYNPTNTINSSVFK